jgi:TrbC/VIRB2 pilin
MTRSVAHTRHHIAIALTVSFLAWATTAPAHAAGSNMPWEQPLQQILQSIEGPVAKVARRHGVRPGVRGGQDLFWILTPQDVIPHEAATVREPSSMPKPPAGKARRRCDGGRRARAQGNHGEQDETDETHGESPGK